MKSIFTSLIFGVLILCTSGTSSPLPVPSDHNVLVFTSVEMTNGSIGGSVAAGGDALFTNVTIAGGNGGSLGATPPSGPGVVNLVVGGNLNWSNGELILGSGTYGGVGTFSNITSPDGTISQSAPSINFAELANSAQSLSADFAGRADNGTVNLQFGQLTLTGTDSELNVFDVAGAVLGSANTVSIVVPDGAAVLINVTGTDTTFQNEGLLLNGSSFQSNLNAEAWSQVLWNFAAAGTFSISGEDFGGTLLAPNAAVSVTNSQFNGQLIASSLTSSGQINNFAFDGATAVPEPGTLGMFGLGMLFLAGGVYRLNSRSHTRAPGAQ